MASLITVEALSAADRDALLTLDQSAFAFDDRDLEPDEATGWIEWDRVWGARRDGSLGGIYTVFSFGIGVPGGPGRPAAAVPMAGLSWVAVHPDHRRQGVLSTMMRHHLRDTYENDRGEAVSGLFASESSIYGRFGYGVATESRRLTIGAKAVLRPLRHPGNVTTRFEAADRAVHDKVLQQVYDAECRLRPGHTIRPARQWERHLADQPSRRPGGAEALKVVVAERDGEPTGYAVLRRTAAWGQHTPKGTVQVNDLHAVDPPSAHALWQRVLGFDLMAEVTTPCIALDDPLMVWASDADPRARKGHSFWARLVDVGVGLSTRGYAGDLDVVLDVADQVCPWNAGRWRLSAGADGAVCEKTPDPADLALDVRELGSAYLGGVTLESLGRAGLVDELTPGALEACSAAWRSPVLPATPYMF